MGFWSMPDGAPIPATITAFFALQLACGTPSMTMGLSRLVRGLFWIRRPTFCFMFVIEKTSLQRTIDVVQKQNLVARAIAKKTCSSVSQGLKEAIQNGPVEKSLSGADASAAVTQNDDTNVDLSKEILSKEASAPKSSRFSSECLALKNGAISEPSPNVALSKHQVEGLPVLNSTLEKSMPP